MDITKKENICQSLPLLDPNSPQFFEHLWATLSILIANQTHPIFQVREQLHKCLNSLQRILLQLKNNVINEKNCELLRVLRRGCFTETHLVRHRISRRLLTMTILDRESSKGRALTADDSADFAGNRNLLTMAGSVWIAPLISSFMDKANLYLCMEYMPGGDLVNWLTNNEDISEDQAAFYSAELVLGLEALHSMGFIHRDVKPENMLLDRGGHVKLADFGTCVRLGPEGFVQTSSAIGTPDYISPEVLFCQEKSGKIGPQCDWWALGVVLFEMLFGETAFYGDSLVVTYGRIMNFKTSLSIPDDISVSDEAIDIIKSLLTDPETRLGSKGSNEVKSHPFYNRKSWSWDNIRRCVPPFVPELTSEVNTCNFDDIEDKSKRKKIDKAPISVNQKHSTFGCTLNRDCAIISDVGISELRSSALPLDHVLLEELKSRDKTFSSQQFYSQIQVKKLQNRQHLQNLELFNLERKIETMENEKKDYTKLVEQANQALIDVHLERKQHIEELEFPIIQENVETESECFKSAVSDTNDLFSVCVAQETINSLGDAQRKLESELNKATSRLNSLEEDNISLQEKITHLSKKEKYQTHLRIKCEELCSSMTAELKTNQQTLKSLLSNLAIETRLRKQHVDQISELKTTLFNSEKVREFDIQAYRDLKCEKEFKERELLDLQEQLRLSSEASISELSELKEVISCLELENEDTSRQMSTAKSNLKQADILIDDLYRQMEGLKKGKAHTTLPLSLNTAHSLEAFVEVCRTDRSQVPGKWFSQYAVLKAFSFFLYESQDDLDSGCPPILELLLDQVALVREVSQVDVLNVKAEDLARIYQIIYYPELDTKPSSPAFQTGGAVRWRGHSLQPMRFRTSTNCHACNRICSDMFVPPPALQCTNCHIKIHYEHVDKRQRIAACTHASKIQLVKVASVKDKHNWIGRFNELKGIMKKVNFALTDAATTSDVGYVTQL